MGAVAARIASAAAVTEEPAGARCLTAAAMRITTPKVGEIAVRSVAPVAVTIRKARLVAELAEVLQTRLALVRGAWPVRRVLLCLPSTLRRTPAEKYQTQEESVFADSVLAEAGTANTAGAHSISTGVPFAG